MKAKEFPRIKTSTSIFTIALLAGMLLGVYHTYQLSGQLKNLAMINDGLQTCHTRVHQTYTANLLTGTGGEYLTKPFLLMTEDCYAELIQMSEEIFAENYKTTQKKLNSLATFVHWFHEKLGASGDKKIVKIDLDNRFQKIEQLRDEVLELNGEKQGSTSDSLSTLKFFLFASGIIIPILVLFDYLSKRRIIKSNREIEKEAEMELGNDDFQILSANIEGIIKRALEVNELSNCSLLFSQFHSDVLDGKMMAYRPKTYVEQRDADLTREVPRSRLEEDKAQYEAPEEVLPALGSVSLDSIVSRVIKRFSDKLFSQGIVMEVDADDDIHVMADEESLEHVFFQLISNAVASCSFMPDNKKVSIKIKKLGGTILVSVSDTGIGFSQDFIESNIFDGPGNPHLGSGLSICMDFMADFGGKISFKNSTDQEGKICGASVQLTFRLAQKRATTERTSRLVMVKKGKKKDLIDSLSA